LHCELWQFVKAFEMLAIALQAIAALLRRNIGGVIAEERFDRLEAAISERALQDAAKHASQVAVDRAFAEHMFAADRGSPPPVRAWQ
jgi:hypothetical protein